MVWAGPADRQDTDEAAPDGQIDELVGTDKWTHKLHYKKKHAYTYTEGSINRRGIDRHKYQSEPWDSRQEARADTLTLHAPQHGPHMHLAGSSRHRQGLGPGCTLSSSGDGHSWLCSLVSPQHGSQPGASSTESE